MVVIINTQELLQNLETRGLCLRDNLAREMTRWHCTTELKRVPTELRSEEAAP